MPIKIVFTILVFFKISFSYAQIKDVNVEIEKLKTENILLNAKIQALESKLEVLKLQFENFKLNNPSLKATNEKNTNVISPVTSSSGMINQTPVSSPAYSGQCSALTKKGTRCSRAARSKGLCWQHGG